MKKHLDLKFLFIVILIKAIIVILVNPYNIIPLKQKEVERIILDSIPYEVRDTILFEVEVEVEVPYEVLVDVPVIPIVDTLEILKIYFLKNEITETLVLPNNVGTITLSEIVSENKIIERKITDSKLKKEVVLDTIFLAENPKTKYYYGLNFSTNREDLINSMGLGMMVKTKSDKIYRVDLGVNNRVFDGTVGRLSPYLGGGVYWKISSKNNNF